MRPPPRHRNNTQGDAKLMQRASYVASLKDTGNKSETARLKGTTRKTVGKWAACAERDPDALLRDAPRSGRPSKVKMLASNVDAVALLKEAVRNGLKCSAMALLLRQKLDISVGREVVRLFLKDHIAKALKPRKGTKLTTRHKVKRLNFCQQQHSWDETCVTDSTNFYFPLDRSVGQTNWVLFEDLDDDDLSVRHDERKWQVRIHAYAAVTKWGRSRLILAGGTSIKAPGLPTDAKAVDHKEYLRVLEHELVPECRRLMAQRPRRSQRRKWTFQQDNAPAHKHKKVIRWLKEQAEEFNVMEWPSRSPDLSWIENLWAYTKQRLRRRTDLTADNFWNAVQEEWDNMDEVVYQRTFESITRRMQSCIAKSGGKTKY